MKGAENTEKFNPIYVLVTAAHNEDAFIEKTIGAVISQTLPPERWVIVSDASVDNTDKIVQEYAERYKFIELVRLAGSHVRNFASQVHALNAGVERLKGIDYEFIGFLDADVSFEPSYFGRVLEKFEDDPNLGLAGGWIHEKHNEKFTSRAHNNAGSVPGAVQMFRLECYESVGGMIPLKYGGSDWCAQVMASMKGWRGRAFPELTVFHHRATGRGMGLLRYHYQSGLADFSLGSYPLYVIVSCLRRIGTKPYVAGALARLAGFLWAGCRKEERPVPREFIEYLRGKQKAEVRYFFLRPIIRPADGRNKAKAGLIRKYVTESGKDFFANYRKTEKR